MSIVVRRVGTVVVAGALALVLGACSSSKKSSAGTAPTSAAEAPATATTVAAVVDTITIKGFAFSPETLTVKAGATVTVTNNDQAPHTVSSDDGTSFDAKTVSPGASATFTAPSKPGTYKYHCNIHAQMSHRTLVVQ